MIGRSAMLAFIALAATVCLFVFLLRPGRALAQGETATGVAHSEHLEMAIKAGFGKLEANNFTGNWVPFRIFLSNTGEKVGGRIVVSAKSPPSPNSQLREFVKEIQLAPGSQSLHEIPVFLNSGEDVSVSVESNGSVLLGTTLKVERSFQSDQLSIAVLDSEATTLNSINALEIFRSPNRDPFKLGPPPSASPAQNQPANVAAPGVTQQTPPPPPGGRRGGRFFSNQQGPAARPVVIPAEDLPRDFVSYDSLDALVLGDAPLTQLTEEQSRALKLWVASGGFLIVTAATDFAGLKSSGLSALMPVEPQGGVTAGSLPELTETYGRFESNDALPVMASRPRGAARTLLGTAQQPIVAEKNYGSGLVRFVAFNPKVNPYRAWGAGKNLWSDVLLPAAEARSRATNWMTVGRRGANSAGVQDFLFRLADIQPSSANYFLLFLLAYILTVGPINYVVLRWFKKTDLAWLTIPAVVIAFTSVSVVVAQLSRGGRSLAADASLVEVHQQEGITRSLTALLIMPTSPGHDHLTLEGSETFANDAADFSNSPTSNSEPIEYSRNGGRYTVGLPLNTWTSSILKVRSVAESGPPVVAVEETKSEAGRSPLVVIKNLGSVPIARAVYVSAVGVSQLFDLAPGEQQRLDLTSPRSLAPGSFNSWYLAQLGADSLEGDVYKDFSIALDREIGGQEVLTKGFFETAMMQAAVPQLERPLVVGFADKDGVAFDFSRALKRRSKSLYVIHI